MTANGNRTRTQQQTTHRQPYPVMIRTRVLSSRVAFVHGATPPPGSHGCPPGADHHLNCPFRVTVCQALVGGDTGRQRGHPRYRSPPGVDRRRRRHRVDAAGPAAAGPRRPPPHEASRFSGRLVARAQPDGSELTSYLVSFLVIAQFWMVHHRVLRGMRGHSEGLAWRNFGFLLALTLMPFTSDLIGRYGTNPLAITLFGLNLVAISLSTQWIFLYAAKHNLIKDVARSTHDERTARVRVILVLSIVALSIVLAWTAPSWRSSSGCSSWWSRQWPCASPGGSKITTADPRRREDRARSCSRSPPYDGSAGRSRAVTCVAW